MHRVGNNGIQVQISGGQQIRHLIPRIPNTPSHDSLEIDPVKDDRIQVNRLNRLSVHSQKANSSPRAGALYGQRQRAWMSGHFQSSVYAPRTGLQNSVLKVAVSRRKHQVGPHLMGKINSVRGNFGGNYFRGPGRLADGHGEQADGSHTRDKNRLVLDRSRHGRVDGIPKCVLERGYSGRNGYVRQSGILPGNNYVSGKPTIDVDP